MLGRNTVREREKKEKWSKVIQVEGGISEKNKQEKAKAWRIDKKKKT